MLNVSGEVCEFIRILIAADVKRENVSSQEIVHVDSRDAIRKGVWCSRQTAIEINGIVDAAYSVYGHYFPAPELSWSAYLMSFAWIHTNQSRPLDVGASRNGVRMGRALRLVDRGSDARTLAKEASGPVEGGIGYEGPVVDWIGDAGNEYHTAK